MDKLATKQQVKNCISAVKGYADKILIAVTDAIEALDTSKVEKTEAVSIVIPAATGWGSDATVPDYPFYYDIPVNGVTAHDRATITIAPASIGTAASCKLCPTNETLAGKIRVRSVSVPAKSIVAEYWIEQGKE